MTLGKIIQAARKKAGLTQAQLGKELKVSGSMIGQWEKDLRKPKPATIGRMTAVLGDDFAKDVLAEVDKSVYALLEKKGKSDQDIQKKINARIEELKPKAEVEENTRTTDFIKSPIGKSIIYIFYELNKLGQSEAEKRLYELAEIPKYRRNNAVASDFISLEVKDTNNEKKPSEGAQTPQDGE